MTDAQRGWDSTFEVFESAPLDEILQRLRVFVADASPEQERAWKESIPPMQRGVSESIRSVPSASTYTTVLEYQLPLEFRRADAVFLLRSDVVVVELKGKSIPNAADLDQAQAYARDLRAYHAECESRSVHAVLIPTRAKGEIRSEGGVYVCPPDRLDELLLELDRRRQGPPISPDEFLAEEAYRPLPTLVRAARELFERGSLRRVKKAAAATEPATETLLRLAHDAARQGRRKLVLVSGVPGAGKTLVGLRLVHSPLLDDLAVERAGGKSSVPAVFLSGNGPLVEVLSYELRDAGGGGKTFVRGVKQYVQRHVRGVVPTEHVIVYDEAQRAYDAAMVAEKHDQSPDTAYSEPELFIQFAGRIPEWCVVVALIGGGQEIHKGEEAGTAQWGEALRKLADLQSWDVHGPAGLRDAFEDLPYHTEPDLNLDKSLRSHLAFDVHKYVAELVRIQSRALPNFVAEKAPQYGALISPIGEPSDELNALARKLASDGHHLRITRDLEAAKRYLRDRYADDALARFGLLASSRDRDLARFKVSNDFQSTKRTKFGPWYGDDESAEGGRSCRHLRECVTEFGAQGLELDGVLLAWGTDFIRKHGAWSIAKSARYQRAGAPVRDPAQLRANAYRVLLTRARDVTIVFVPPLPELDETYEFLCACGFEKLLSPL